jgi:molecular chaperone DnaK
MARTTIDFGIDLGTTNSAIALLRGTSTDIIKNNLDNDITPSAVYIDKHGSIRVGLRAKSRLEDERAAEDAYVEFKRRMGTAHSYEFQSAGLAKTPEELSAEVLKSLRGDVQQRLHEEIRAAVITVPAAFSQVQCVATRKAAELAGLVQSPLVQEPVAAALAYGFQVESNKGYWLIYDFGGGTFDAALMKAEDGTIVVVNHGGDEYLGGSDIDWAIVEKIILPKLRKDYNFPDISRANRKWYSTLAKIKNATEIAKIELSRSESTHLECANIKDAGGEEIDLDIKLTRGELISLAEPFIIRSIEICKQVIKEKNLNPSAIGKAILVGGPTLAPYFQEILASNLGIPLDFSVNPLTVVARGAAVFAGTQRIEGAFLPKATAGQYEIDLKYKPIGADEDPIVRGTVKLEPDMIVDGFTIEFVNQQTHWRSGKIPLKDKGNFKASLLAEKGIQNEFAIELRDPTGKRFQTVPDSINYTVGLSISEQPIIHSISVALANNETDFFFRKGEPLPAKTMKVYRSTHAVVKGSNEHILNVPIVEGENEQADRNRRLGGLVIPGRNVRRDLPVGSEIEITLHMDSSRMIRIKAYIPILDEEYEAIIDYDRSSPTIPHLQKQYEEERERLESIRIKAENADDESTVALLDNVENSQDLVAIEELIDAAKADSTAAKNAEKRLLEVKVKIDRAENAIMWPALVAEANQGIEDLESLVKQHGTEKQQRQAAKLREQAEEFIQQKRAETLRRHTKRISELYHEILLAQPEFWVGYFRYLIDQRADMRDQETAKRLFNQGQECIEHESIQGLRNVVAQLLGLLPEEEVARIQRGYQSSLLK